MTEILYNNKDFDDNTTAIIYNIKDYKRLHCRNHDIPTCRINDEKIKNIAYFFTSVITKCPNTNVSLDDIKKLNIIGKGTFGYGVSLPNKIIKIIICEDKIDEDLMYEISYNKIITNSKNNYFIKLLGYFLRNKDKYEYYDHTNNFKNKICFTKSDNLNNLCEIYLLLEKAEFGELFTNYLSIYPDDLSLSINKLLNMYTINKYFIENNKVIFVHGDIKSDNIVITNRNEYKLIDYGLAASNKKFFFKSYQRLTYYKNLYDDPYRDNIYLSPFYDIFCILYTFWTLRFRNNNLDIIYDYIIDTKTNDVILMRNKYIFILMYIIHDIFYKLPLLIKIPAYQDEFIDIKMIRYIYKLVFTNDNIDNIIYTNTGNKLLDDYNYFDNIMRYLLDSIKPNKIINSNVDSYSIMEMISTYINNHIEYLDDKLINMINNCSDGTIILALILKVKNINILDDKKNNLLHHVINKNLSINIISELIKKSININQINDDLESPLSLAINKKTSENIITLLIKNGSDINYVDRNEESIFHLLLKNNYNNLIHYIINKNIIYNIKDNNDNNELQHALIKKLPDNILEILIDKVNINNINKNGYNSLNLAIFNKNQNIVKKLIEKNIEIIDNMNNNKSIIYLCIENDILDESILTYILDKSKIDISTSISPLNLSIFKNISVGIIERMIDIFDINYIDENGYNSLLSLCSRINNENFNEYYKLIIKLINKGVNINQQNIVGANSIATLLDISNKLSYNNKLILINLLIDNNIDLICEKLNNPYDSLLCMALKNNLPDKLIDKFINKTTINYLNEFNQNALFCALSKSYNINVIKKLIDNGINIKQISTNNSVPLLVAINNPKINIDIIKLLIHPDIINIDISKSISKSNKQSLFIIDIAIEKRDLNIIGLLLINDSLLSDKTIDALINKYSEKECIELLKLSTYIKKNIHDYINFFEKKYKSIDKHIDTVKYKKYKHIYKELLQLKK
jgi:ankyrin repeat protein